MDNVRTLWARTLCALSLLAAGAHAQSFNIDVGENVALPAPAPSYTAAAGQTGFWNALQEPFDGTLQNLSGSSSGVSLSSSNRFAINDSCAGGALAGDDQLLMSDAQSIPGFALPTEWTFDGLLNGRYTLYTYAWCVNPFVGSTYIMVPGSPDPGQHVFGDWSGSPHILGITYARHLVMVTDGTLEVRVSSTSPVDAPSRLNGFQLVLESAETGNFCSSTPNSTGAPAVMSFTGSTSVIANDIDLFASPVPDSPGVFFYGGETLQAPFGGGLRCVGGQTFRLPIGIGMAGVLTHDLDSSAPPAPAGTITPGSVWFFQAWFRDPLTGGAGFDLSDGLAIAFTP